MPLFPTKLWVSIVLAEIRDQFRMFPMPWNTREVNSLVYLKEDKNADRLCIHRSSDNQMLLYMVSNGDVYLLHMGLWETDMAAAIGESLILLNRIHKERMQTDMDAKNAEIGDIFGLPTEMRTR